MMLQRKIKLRPDEAKDFVAAATRCLFDVDISYNSFIVDAKSILGVLGLNFDQVLTVSYNGHDEDFEKYLQKFAVAC
ncbi:MAG: HPr family phosphocarrier protein [Muribaculaceae bacterium]|nr:HPr family phosphocarrier protein [Muribaculaceae bacterium]